MAGSQLGWEPGWFVKAQEAAVHWACRPQGAWAALQGPAVERRPQPGPASTGLISGALTLPAQERRQVCQHGLTRSHSCPCCHPVQGLSVPICVSPFLSQAVAILIPAYMSGLPQKTLTKDLELLSGRRDWVVFPLYPSSKV